MHTEDIFPWFSVAALMVASISPVAVGIYSHSARRKDAEDARLSRKKEKDEEEQRRQQEDRRRNEVAAEAFRVAEQLVAQNRELNEKTTTKMDQVAEAVHQVLPNGNVTAAMESELAAHRTALAAMTDTARLKEKAGAPVLPEEYERIAALKLQIEALNAQIYNRKHGK